MSKNDDNNMYCVLKLLDIPFVIEKCLSCCAIIKHERIEILMTDTVTFFCSFFYLIFQLLFNSFIFLSLHATLSYFSSLPIIHSLCMYEAMLLCFLSTIGLRNGMCMKKEKETTN